MSGTNVTAGAPNPGSHSQVKIGGPFDKLAPGRFIVYTDMRGGEYVGVVTNVLNDAGVINLVTFGKHGGEAPTQLELEIQYKPDEEPARRLHGWRWPTML